MQDPSGNIVDRWESTANLGIVLREFPLSQTAAVGRWVIAATVNVGLLLFSPFARCDGIRRNIFSSELPSSYMQGVTDEKPFVVELHGNVHIDLFQFTPDGLCSIGQFEDRRQWLT